MKTNKLLIGAMAVMTFAACQNDEFVSESLNAETGRPQVKVALDVEKGALGEAETRFTFNGTQGVWADGDKIGSSIVDVAQLGTIADNSHMGNIKFEYTNGKFTTASTMSVGWHMFYYPYNEDNTKTRGGIIVKELPVQKYDKTGANIAANDFLVSPVVQIAGEEGNELVLPMKMRSIYGYTTLNITNTTKGDAKKAFQVQKVVISNGDDKFVLGGVLQPAAATTSSPDTLRALRASTLGVANLDSLFAAADSAYNFIKGTEKTKRTAVAWVKESSTIVKGNVAVDFLTGYTGVTVEPGATLTTKLLVPAGNYAKNTFKVTVYTDCGIQELNPNDSVIVDDFGLNVVRFANNRTRNINLNVGDLTAPQNNAISVINENDLIASLKQYSDATGTPTVTVTALNALTIDQTVLSELPLDKIKVAFTGGKDITFTGDLTLKNIGFAANNAGKLILKSGTFNLSDFTIGQGNTMELNEDAVVTFGTGMTYGASSKVNVNADATLNISTAMTSGTLVVNGGTLNTNAPTPAATYTVNFIKVEKGIMNVNGSVRLANDLVVGDATSAEINSYLNLNAEVTMAANMGITINKSAKLVNKADNTIEMNESTIDLNGGFLKVTTNNGTINNNVPVVNADATGQLEVGENYGEINTCAKSQTKITTKNEGIINYVENAYINGNYGGAHKETGNVVMTIDADIDMATLAAKLNSKVTALKIKNNATLTIANAETDVLKAQAAALYNIKAITLENATVVNNVLAPNAVPFTHCPIFAYGNVELNGVGTFAFAGHTTANLANADEDVIFVKNIEDAAKSVLTINTNIIGLYNINIEAGATVVNNAKVSGDVALTLPEGANWYGEDYIQM